jgi:hypothetical protein
MIHVRVKITCDACGLVLFPLAHEDGTREIQDIASDAGPVAADLTRHAIWSCVRLGATLHAGRVYCAGCRRVIHRSGALRGDILDDIQTDKDVP